MQPLESFEERLGETGKDLEACPAKTDLTRKDSDGCMEFYKLETQSSLPESISVTNDEHEKLTRNLSPLTVMGMDLEGKRGTRIRRAHSTASFERYKQDKQVHINLMRNVTSSHASRSGNNTPQRWPSGPETPNRSRNPSGFQTPLSSILYDTSSISSMGEEGTFILMSNLVILNRRSMTGINGQNGLLNCFLKQATMQIPVTVMKKDR